MLTEQHVQCRFVMNQHRLKKTRCKFYTRPWTRCNYVDIKQLLDEVEHDIMNYQSRGLCYLPKPKAEADNTLLLFAFLLFACDFDRVCLGARVKTSTRPSTHASTCGHVVAFN